MNFRVVCLIALILSLIHAGIGQQPAKAADGLDDEVAQAIERGVAFLKEVVRRRAVAAVARRAYNESFVVRPMTFDVRPGRIDYRWQNDAGWLGFGAEVVGDPQPPAPGSETEYIAEHYWGYTKTADNGCLEYRVTHEPWRVWPAREARFEGDPSPLYGPRFARVLERRPDSALLAEGSPIAVFSAVRKQATS